MDGGREGGRREAFASVMIKQVLQLLCFSTWPNCKTHSWMAATYKMSG
jgi:hypothetical protein